MAIDLTGLSSNLMNFMYSFLFWGLMVFIFITMSFGFLILRKWLKWNRPVVIMTPLGSKKVAIQTTKGGWFKEKTVFFGLFDYKGNDVFKVKKRGIVQELSSEDYHEINGKRGVICWVKGDDPNVFVPVNEGYVKPNIKIFNGTVIPSVDLDDESKEMIFCVAPADYRDTSKKIIASAENEMKKFWDQYGSLITAVTLGILVLVAVIVIIQYAKHSQKEAYDFTAKTIGDVRKGGIASTTAPLMLPLLFRRKKRNENRSKKNRTKPIQPDD